jgi:D-3-phosphoglycerate dehydrogenase
MNFQKILMVGFTEEDFDSIGWQRIKTLCQRHVLVPKDDGSIADELSDSDCLLVKLGATVDRNMIDSAPKLKYIGMYGTGYGRIDTQYAQEKGITVCNIAGYSTNGVAELAFALILESIRDVSRAKINAQRGEYSEDSFSGYEISSKKFGIIGMGRIGTRISEIASKGFGAEVLYWSKNRKPECESSTVSYVADIKELTANSDFISFNLAYNQDTEEIFSEDLIKLVKSGAVIINLSPMELVDINALSARLEKKDITFILDHSDELSEAQAKQLSAYDNCVMYPPIGYITDEATVGKKVMFVDNLQNYLDGKPSNKVN